MFLVAANVDVSAATVEVIEMLGVVPLRDVSVMKILLLLEVFRVVVRGKVVSIYVEVVAVVLSIIMLSEGKSVLGGVDFHAKNPTITTANTPAKLKEIRLIALFFFSFSANILSPRLIIYSACF